ncbi:MAG: hypothetical protein IPH40_06920 [Polaromonas sp.]|nr:hypothetical protein [Polaromonas sp.]
MERRLACFSRPGFRQMRSWPANDFFCSTAKGKTIEVCDAGKTITYTFGSPQAKPEISLNVPRDKVTTFQWNGIGRYLSYAVDIPNGTTTYSVFHGMDRITKEHAIEAGVNVLVDGKLLATVRRSGRNIVNNLEGVDLAPTP